MKVSKGTIFKRKDSPFLYLNLSVDGKRFIQKTKYYHNEIDTVKNEVLPLVRAKILTGEITLDKKEKQVIKTFKHYSNLFLNSRKYLKDGTTRRYINCVDRFNITFGSFNIDEIKASDIKNYLFEMDIKPLTFRNYLYVFKGIFHEALLDEVIDYNICERINIPKNNNVSEVQPFSIDEVKRILDNADGYFKNFLATAFYTGCRTGELFALKWQNVDLIKKRIYIDSTRGDYKEGSPKTGKNRYVPIFDSLIPYLKNQSKLTGMKNYVFLTDRGKNLTSSNLADYKWYPLLKRLKIPKRVIYNTRHTFATNMIQSEQFSINQIANWLGHTNIRMVVSHYNKFIDSEINKYDSNVDVFCLEKRHKGSKTA